MDGVTKISHSAQRKVCGVGYVILSRAQDRDTYIGSCFRNNMVTILTEENEIVPKCIVAKNAWQWLEFPTTSNERGSAVIWVNIPYQNKIVVLDILHKRDELNHIQSTGEFKLQRKVDQNIVTIHGNGTNGVINIISQGAQQGEGEIYIKVLNESELAIFDLYVQGIGNFTTESDLNFTIGGELNFLVQDPANPKAQAILNYTLGTGLTFTDEFENAIYSQNGGLYLQTTAANKVYARAGFGTPSQPGVLGDNLNSFLNDIKNLLNSIVITLQSASGSGPNVSSGPIVAQVATWLISIETMQAKIAAGNILAKNFECS